eukprot:TRINITY_DN6561_c0_g1_i1.p1 TRINITY_DN6561_c0_g1~~TRINITY_DN6561_c0_g1_i1.p1  ORF type:complete len:1241 (+),score=323.64 TRINITY_DN6561_c0_g1_i1:316-4038(+)
MGFKTTETLKKMDDLDYDIRYMAISDLMAELNTEGFKIDSSGEVNLVQKLLNLVSHDPTSAVRDIAVKCLGALAPILREEQIHTVVTQLSEFVLTTDLELSIRDLASHALRVVIGEVKDNHSKTVNLLVSVLVPKLIDAVRSADEDAVLLCLNVLSDLISRFGRNMQDQMEQAQSAVLPQLTANKSTSRKRACECLSHMSSSLDDALFESLIIHIVEGMPSQSKAIYTLSYIQALDGICRQVGWRLSTKLEDIIPLLSKFITDPDFGEDIDDEIREVSLQAIESFLLRCPIEMETYIDSLIKIAVEYVQHDPFYEYDEEEGGNAEEDSIGDDSFGSFDDSFGDFDYSNESFSDVEIQGDDDISWKVRKASTRVLTAIIQTKPSRLVALCDSVAPVLVIQFRERETNIKVDVFNTFKQILYQVHATFSLEAKEKISELVPSIIGRVTKEFSSKNINTRLGVFELLRELLVVLPGCLSDHIPAVVTGLVTALNPEDTATPPLKIEALSFASVLLENTPVEAFYQHLENIIAPLIQNVSEPYFKITSAALNACEKLVHVLIPNDSFSSETHIAVFSGAVEEKLVDNNAEEEVRIAAISCTGSMIALLGPALSNSEIFLEHLLARLSGEVTRIAVVKAFEVIADAENKVDLSSVLGEIIEKMGALLRKNDRYLQQACLITLTKIIKKYGKKRAAHSKFDGLLNELQNLINENDFSLAQLSMRLAAGIIRVNSNSAEQIENLILPKCIELIMNPVFGGLAQDAVLVLFKDLSKKLPADVLFDALNPPKDADIKVLRTIAKCIAVLVKYIEENKDENIAKYINDARRSKFETEKILALYTLGEIGCLMDITSASSLKKNILHGFDSSSKYVNTAASVSFGLVAIGNISKMLPVILAEMDNKPQRQQLLLGSLREVIVRQSTTTKRRKAISEYVSEFLDLLFRHIECDDEQIRNTISECLGKLLLIDPETVLSALKEQAHSESPLVRACAVNSIRSTYSDKHTKADDVIFESIDEFLGSLEDPDLEVSSAGIHCLKYVLQHKSADMKPQLHKYLPILYSFCEPKEELITITRVGPFRHREDLGLPTRRTAFEILLLLLDSCLDTIEIPELITQIAMGIADDESEVVFLALHAFSRVCKLEPVYVLSKLEIILASITKNIDKKVSEKDTPQEASLKNEIIVGLLKAVSEIENIPGVTELTAFNDFFHETIVAKSKFWREEDGKKDDSNMKLNLYQPTISFLNNKDWGI